MLLDTESRLVNIIGYVSNRELCFLLILWWEFSRALESLFFVRVRYLGSCSRGNGLWVGGSEI